MINTQDSYETGSGMTCIGSIPAAFAALLLVAAPTIDPDVVPSSGESIDIVGDTVPVPRAPGARLLFSPGYLSRIVEVSRRGEVLEVPLTVEVEPPTHESLAAIYAHRYGISQDLALKIVGSAIAEGLDPELGFRLVRVESVFRESARGPGGALGLTQLMPSTARAIDRSLRTDGQILEPTTNLRTGFRYLRRMIDRYDGDVRLGVLAYNRGEGAVDRALRSGRDPENGYSRKVLGTGRTRYTGPGVAIRDP
jgi:soluble lytic murein transglycosylase-like protein